MFIGRAEPNVSVRAQTDSGLEPVAYETDGRIEQVRLHRGWASVMRRVEVTMSDPRIEVLITKLPDSLLTDSLHIEIAGDAGQQVLAREVHIVSVPDYTGWEEEKARVRTRYERLRAKLEEARRESSELNETLGEQIRSVDERELQNVLHELTDLEARGPSDVRAARVLLVLNEGIEPSAVLNSTIVLNMTYIVTGADWLPVYTLRTVPISSTASLEADVLVGQRTGEDWTDVVLIVSSSPGRMAEWRSVFRTSEIDVAKNRSDDASAAPVGGGEQPSAEKIFDSVVGDGAVFLERDVLPDWTNSPIVERRIPGRVDVPNDTLAAETSGRERSATHDNSARIRFRLESFRFRCDIRYVGIPAVSQHAFLIGTIRNVREHHLLPGPMSLFRDSEYAGELLFPGLAPSETIDVALGTDPDLLVHRRELDRRKRKTGLLGDGREVQIDYRMSVTNRTGRDLPVELWDQIPVAADDRLSITVSNPSKALSTGADYLELQRPHGLLRWDLDVPTSGGGPVTPTIIDYTLVISHHKDVEPDWIPN